MAVRRRTSAPQPAPAQLLTLRPVFTHPAQPVKNGAKLHKPFRLPRRQRKLITANLHRNLLLTGLHEYQPEEETHAAIYALTSISPSSTYLFLTIKSAKTRTRESNLRSFNHYSSAPNCEALGLHSLMSEYPNNHIASLSRPMANTVTGPTSGFKACLYQDSLSSMPSAVNLV